MIEAKKKVSGVKSIPARGKKQILTNQKVNTLVTVTEVKGAETNPMIYIGFSIAVSLVVFILYKFLKR